MIAKRIVGIVAIGFLLSACAANSTQVSASDCAQTRLDSVKLLCQADTIRSQRVKYSVGGALVGAVIGGAAVAIDGGDVEKGVLGGAVVGALVGYWLNERNAIAREHASINARANELQRRADQAVSVRRAHNQSLRRELELARRISDQDKRIAAIQNIIQAERLADEEYRNKQDGLQKALPPRLDVPESKAPNMPDGLFAGQVAETGCDILIGFDEGCFS